MIDFYSDTKTRPSRAMREAMLDAPVGRARAHEQRDVARARDRARSAIVASFVLCLNRLRQQERQRPRAKEIARLQKNCIGTAARKLRPVLVHLNAVAVRPGVQTHVL